MVIKICELCKRKFKSKAKRFCSVKCSNIGFRGSNNPNWSGGLKYLTGICLICKNEFKYTKSNYSGKYCSRKCYFESRKGIPQKGLVIGHNKIRKLGDKEILNIWEIAKSNKDKPLYSFFRNYYAKTPNFRLRKLVPDEYKEYCKYKKTVHKGLTRNYERGRNSEYRARKELQKDGYYVMRSSGSLTQFDLIAINLEKVLLIQIKRQKTPRSISRYKSNILEIQRIQTPTNCSKQLWIWMDNKGWKKHII